MSRQVFRRKDMERSADSCGGKRVMRRGLSWDHC